MVLRKKLLTIVLDIFQKVNKPNKELLNQNQRKLVIFLLNKTKRISQNNKKFLNIVSASGFGKNK